MEQNFYAWHEGDMSRMERANKRLWIIILVLIVALIGSNLGWIIYESQFYDEISYEAEQETEDGSNYFVGGNFNGEAKDKGN